MSTNQKRTGIYPGTFDPITKGHLHIIQRASHLTDYLYVAVAENPGKSPLFKLEERLHLVKQDIENLHDKGCPIEVVQFNNLLVDLAREKQASCLFRGLRAVSDFEYEFQMTGMNAKIAPDVETVFLMASEKWQFVSSSFVKEIARLNGDIKQFVTPQVHDKIIEAYGK
jgi:pantetheine-phosphate adenylyltransferase